MALGSSYNIFLLNTYRQQASDLSNKSMERRQAQHHQYAVLVVVRNAMVTPRHTVH